MIDDPDTQAQWKQGLYQQRSHPSQWSQTWSVEEVTTVNLEALRSVVPELQRIHRQIAEARARHTHGIIYAIELKPRDALRVNIHSSMGIIYPDGLGPDRLFAKVIVPPTTEWLPMYDDRALKIKTGTESFGALHHQLRNVVNTKPEWQDNDEIIAEVVRQLSARLKVGDLSAWRK